MQITEHIHALEIPFKIPVAPEKFIDRVVYVYLVFGDKITLIDTGVSGTESIIFGYIKNNGRGPQEISMLILSHSHPDHLGAAKAIKETTGCNVSAHINEKRWIEDTDRQFEDRPVPGFHTIVGGSVAVDRHLEDGELLELGEELESKVIHTPGHSKGSISLFFEKEKALFTGDALLPSGDLPIYENISSCIESIKRLKSIDGVEILLSSFEPPIRGRENINKSIEKSISYLQRIHNSVLEASKVREDIMELCKLVISNLGLPPFAANPLVAKAFASSLAVKDNKKLFEI
jgi:hydroxyacylglutathione hydrolase